MQKLNMNWGSDECFYEMFVIQRKDRLRLYCRGRNSLTDSSIILSEDLSNAYQVNEQLLHQTHTQDIQ